MPNLKAILQQHQLRGLNVSEVPTTDSQSSMDSEGSKIKTMLQNYAAPIASSESESPMPDNSSSNNEKIPAPSFSLVKLFIKQKSSSSDTCMDVSSGCWPSDSTNSSTEHPGNCSNTSLNRLRKKSMNDSGKFSALSKHEEDAEYQLDSLDAHMEGGAGERKTNDFNREIFDSPTHRRHYRDCSLNIRNQMRNPLLFNVLNNNNSSSMRSQSDGSRTSENLTQILLKTVEGGDNSASSKTSVPIDMITKSIQTSTAFFPKAETTESKNLPQSHVKMVPPSFLSQLNKLGEHQQAPVYVIYPNYALPDLEFINNNSVNLKKDIIISPMSYQNYHGQPKMVSLYKF
jgi:iporin